MTTTTLTSPAVGLQGLAEAFRGVDLSEALDRAGTADPEAPARTVGLGLLAARRHRVDTARA